MIDVDKDSVTGIDGTDQSLIESALDVVCLKCGHNSTTLCTKRYDKEVVDGAEGAEVEITYHGLYIRCNKCGAETLIARLSRVFDFDGLLE